MNVTLLGIGMGNPDMLTVAGIRALEEADCILGAQRMLEALPYACEKVSALAAHDIAAAIHARRHFRNIVVVFSGDIGFYSGATALLPLLAEYEVTCLCGISTCQYFAAALRRTWQEMHLLSAHGRDADVVRAVMTHKETFFLTGSNETPADICQRLTAAGMGFVQVTVGERLSYADECITSGSAACLAEKTFHALSAVIVDNPQYRDEVVTYGFDDTVFVRGKTPMTKQEVRAVALSKMQLMATDVVYDIGGGTGSVSVEMARLCARVYSIECNADALALMQENKARFGCYNMEIIDGLAPDALHPLPAPNAVFIGGSKGNLAHIVDCIAAKQAQVRVVITAVTLETLAEATAVLSKYCTPEVTHVAISRGHRAGNYTMMRAENPIYILHGVLDVCD